MRSLGCDHPIDYRSVDYAAAVREITGGEGIDCVLDALGSSDWKKGYSLLAPGGMLVCFGFANASQAGTRNLFKVGVELLKVPRYNPIAMMGDNRSVAGVNLGAMWEHHALIQDGMQQIVAYWEAGVAKPHIDGTYSFEQAAEAHGRLEHGKNVGKVLLIP